MRNPFYRELLTGATTLAALVGLVVTLWLFGELKDLGRKYYFFKLHLDIASNVSDTSQVTLNGVRVGSVVASELEPDPSQGIILTVRIKDGLKIPENFTVFIDRSFVGESTVAFEVPRYKESDGPKPGYIEADAHIHRKAQTLFGSIAEQLKGPSDTLAKASEQIGRLVDTYDEVGKRVSDALEPRTPEEVDAGKAAANIRSTISRIDRAVAGANTWIADDKLRASAREAIEKVSLTADAWTKTAASAEKQISVLAPKAATVGDEAAAALRRVGLAAEELTTAAASVNKGDGTLGLLLRNPDAYNSLRDAAARLERLLVELQVTVERFRSEGIPLDLK